MKRIFRLSTSSLRVRIALYVALPILLALTTLTLVHYVREARLADKLIRLSIQQTGESILGSLRHAMLTNDEKHTVQILDDIGRSSEFSQVLIIDLNGEVKLSSEGADIGRRFSLQDPECQECHIYPPDSRPSSIHLTSSESTLRVTTPIDNEPACATCHGEDNSHLGIMLADVSLVNLEQHQREDLRLELAIAVGSTLVITFGVYLLFHLLVVKRIEAFRQPLKQLSEGSFHVRLPTTSPPRDELEELADAINTMAEELEQHLREQEERSRIRHRAIVEERERIGRELHDGLAQLLSYVNTKAMAIRLLLEKQKYRIASMQLAQLEEAARELYIDTREAILGLKLTGVERLGMRQILQDYTDQFSRLSNLPVNLYVTPELESLSLPPDSEIQILRIIQEALTNIRKHAHAKRAWVDLELENDVITISVIDDGSGFYPHIVQRDENARFGLSTMRERAESIGATFDVQSSPGQGTSVLVQLKLKSGLNSPQAKG